MSIKGFIKTSFLDWDGKIVSTLYVAGCNFRCPFCHNFGLIEKPQSYETVPRARIDKFLLEHKDFIDGICLTGGEPCLHKNSGLFEFLRHIKELGMQIKFDTNGTDPRCLKKAVDENLLDYIAMDIKGPLDERYDKLSGVKTDLTKINESIRFIRDSGVPYEFRMTVVPTLLERVDVRAVAKALAGAQKLILQQFSEKNCWDLSLRKIKPYAKEELEVMAGLAKEFVPDTFLRGV
ncbi:anaerobic ribonucleoside-triphosphate reductase activating protein [candidate division WOR-1 bacterium RIFCSPLOWO2_02_FULL_46_20]|uniref:Anaerobic ribonucleoside-triphosphate reductase activating protein n=2 Tax=Saganbacteria TaxID=1703751 RepID=A0A1F4R4B3_UNCSA|nr:MAG: anaerobic ribonucleoside-triphosphate reductase activating protein [candidate division WOR-1 bacterium RIFCSPHIGHO2_02_FULL_45_12]OGC03009.1 MAG: anaerobic ribonucleoside-triphosphate reductase activating protein [candidate division WOR-1 bacterium RIFCSPLOWO2_02_FULL_46_20]OGC10056.1 MAG: anaerobic ribonucleoside-triphosphate reductase activating protein [candidate division WOR-1 bacterium RIFCSPLOWO2_12_FULL_45_9]